MSAWDGQNTTVGRANKRADFEPVGQTWTCGSSHVYKRWKGKIPDKLERLSFSFASYNTGFGRINKALPKAGGESITEWNEVAPHAPGQTRHYVKKLRRLMGKGARAE